jgi:superfamily II DNA or RNA helicase
MNKTDLCKSLKLGVKAPSLKKKAAIKKVIKKIAPKKVALKKKAAIKKIAPKKVALKKVIKKIAPKKVALMKKKAPAPLKHKVPTGSSDDDDVDLPESNVTPLHHQKKVIETILRPDVKGLLIYHGLGSGKTITSVLAAEAYMKKHPSMRCTVVLSAGVRDQFNAEIKRATNLHARFNAVSREKFLKDHRKCDKNTILIVDEAHNLRNADQGSMTAAVKKCAKQCAKVMLLSATPLVNGIHELGNLLSFFQLPSGAIMPIGAKPFEKAYGKDGLKKPIVLKSQLNCAVSYYCNAKNTVDFPRSSKIKRVWVTMDPEQERLHDAVINRKRAEVLHLLKDPVDANSLAKLLTFLQKPRQICNMVKDSKGVVHQPKIDSLVRRVAAAVASGKKCVVFSQYIAAGVTPIIRALDKLKIKHVEYIGGMTDKYKREAVIKYNSGAAKVFLLSRAGGEGLDLKETGEVHILEPHFHNASLEQVFGRAIRYKSHKDHNTVVTRVVYQSIKNGEDKKDKLATKMDTHSCDFWLWKLARMKSKVIKKFIKQIVIPASIENSPCKGKL